MASAWPTTDAVGIVCASATGYGHARVGFDYELAASVIADGSWSSTQAEE
jgi:hypothetical protein